MTDLTASERSEIALNLITSIQVSKAAIRALDGSDDAIEAIKIEKEELKRMAKELRELYALPC